MGKLDGRTALVVGASRGMGKQMAIELARHGADVAVAARTATDGESSLPGTILETAQEIRALGRRAEAIKVDLANGAEVDAMVARALELFGHIDILAISVQYHGPAYYASFLDATIEQLETMMAVNAMSTVRICKHLVPDMAAHGGGTIVIVTSKAGTAENNRKPGNGSAGLGYPISKAAVGRFVPALAKEVKDAGIAVIGLNPGFVISEHVQAGIVDDQFNGWNTTHGVPPTYPAMSVGYLCTLDEPLAFTGQILESDNLIAEHKLAEPRDSYHGATVTALD